MKLTKKNARRLKAIQKALASGKGLSGLLVGLAAATVAAGCNGRIPFFRTPGKPANFKNEVPDVFVTDGEVPEPPEPVATNAVNEAEDTDPVLAGIPPPPAPPPRPPLQPGQYCVKPGDSLSAIAAKYGVSITTLKQLNGFDDKRADSLKVKEIIKVPVSNTNAVNETRDSALEVKGKIPLGK